MRREYIQMIRADKKFICLVAGSLCFSLLFGGRLPFFIFYSSSLLLIASFIYIYILKSAFAIEVICSDTAITTGACSNVLTKVNFEVPLPVPYVEIRSDAISAGRCEYSGFIHDTAWNENIWIENEVSFPQRGVYELDSVTVRISDLLHIVSYEEQTAFDICIKVYPKIYKIKTLKPGGIDIYREAANKNSRIEDQHIIRDVRKYREGDSIKKIHWKITGKRDELYVKNQDTISGEEVVIFVDMNRKNYSYNDNGIIEERIIDFSASLVNQVIRKNLNINIYLNALTGRKFELNDKKGFDKLMEFLMTQKSDGNLDLYQYIYDNPFKLHRMNKIVIVVAELDEKLTDALIRMSASGYFISVFYCVESDAHKALSLSLEKSQVECFNFQDFIEF